MDKIVDYINPNYVYTPQLKLYDYLGNNTEYYYYNCMFNNIKENIYKYNMLILEALNHYTKLIVKDIIYNDNSLISDLKNFVKYEFVDIREKLKFNCRRSDPNSEPDTDKGFTNLINDKNVIVTFIIILATLFAVEILMLIAILVKLHNLQR